MNDLDNSKSTLPSVLPLGFEDLLPPDAENEFRAIETLMACFSGFSYARIKPPMAEFEDSLLAAGPGEASAETTFRLMDPLSDQMLALRSDITAQIARIARARLADAPRPLRLTYANDVLRTRASQQRTLRQFCQVGCELISEESLEADIEIAVLSLVGLSALGLKGLSIDFCVPRLIGDIARELGLDGAETQAVKESLNARSEDGLLDVFVALLRSAGAADKALAGLQSLDLPAGSSALLERLSGLVVGVSKAIDDLGLDAVITIDPSESKGFEYHCGVGFTLFSKETRGELGRGGRYDIVCNKTGGESAAGFTLYMDTVRKIAPARALPTVKEVSADTPWADIRALQDQGFTVKRGLK